MSIDSPNAQLIANALCEIRSLLGSYLGAENDAPSEVRLAAHIAYALHNEAASLVDGDGFNTKAALRKVAAIDNILQGTEGGRLAAAWRLKATPTALAETGQQRSAATVRRRSLSTNPNNDEE